MSTTSSHLWLLFALGTVCCWGSYGPAIHGATGALGRNQWKALLLVGLAYFLIAVVVPSAMIRASGNDWSFNARGVVFGLVAGALGALGALGVIGAMKHGGKPIYVMPLIFGGAPLINVIVSTIQHPPKAAPNPLFWIGTLVLACGAGMVLYFKPE